MTNKWVAVKLRSLDQVDHNIGRIGNTMNSLRRPLLAGSDPEVDAVSETDINVAVIDEEARRSLSPE